MAITRMVLICAEFTKAARRVFVFVGGPSDPMRAIYPNHAADLRDALRHAVERGGTSSVCSVRGALRFRELSQSRMRPGHADRAGARRAAARGNVRQTKSYIAQIVAKMASHIPPDQINPCGKDSDANIRRSYVGRA